MTVKTDTDNALKTLGEAATSLLVICAHGSAKHPAANDHVLALAKDLGSDSPFDDVRVVFHASEPKSIDMNTLNVEGFDRVVMVPYMMSDGFLADQMISNTRENLQSVGVAAPLLGTPSVGTHPAIVDLCLDLAIRTAKQAGMAPCDMDVVLVAHGSRNAPESRIAATSHYEAIAAKETFKKAHLAFIEEPPYLADTLGAIDRTAVIVGLFAAPGGHAIGDISEAIDSSGKDHFLNAGPVGMHPDMSDIIIRRAREALPQ